MNKNFKYWGVIILTFFLTVLLYGQNQKRVLIEQLSGAWCGLCPDGYVIMDSILQHEHTIGVYLHQGDPMECSSCLVIGSTYTGGGVPAFLLDRYTFASTPFVSFGLEKEEILANLQIRLNQAPTVAVDFESVVFDETLLTASVELEATFLEDLPEGDYRFNLYVIEKEVLVNETDYHQINFYNQLEDHPYENAGNPITNFLHKDVVRHMVGGAWGSAESIPNNVIQKDDQFNFAYTFGWDTNWEFDNIDLVAIVQEYNEEENQQRVILNSNITHFNDWMETEGTGMETWETGIETVNANLPAYYDYNSQSIKISLQESGENSAKLYNVNGQQLKEIPFSQASTHFSTTDLNPGIYFLNVQTRNQNFSGAICIF